MEGGKKTSSRQDLSSNKPKRKASTKLKTTGTTGKEIPKYEKKEDTSQKKLIVAGAASVLLVVAMAVLIFAVMGSTPSECDSLLQDISAQKKPSEALDPMLMAKCYDETCGFDYTQCKAPCPFGFLKDTETNCVNSCECAMNGIFQGDIQFNDDEVEEMMKDYGYISKENDFALFNVWAGKLWNNIEIDGRFKIPYELELTLTEEQYKIFDDSIRNISKHTCLDYIPRMNNEKDHIKITNLGMGCGAYIGRVGSSQLVALPPGCFFESTIQHELSHTLGIDHEHTRQDRDAYVDIHWDNVERQYKHNYGLKEGRAWLDLKTPYQLGSGMHYQSFAFNKDRRKPTLTGKGGVVITYEIDENFLTKEDFQRIDLLYECPDHGPTKVGEWDPWQQWSECSKTCGTGKRSRFRFCIYRATGEKLPAGCNGLPSDVADCATQPCPPSNAQWTEWGNWGKCSKTCDKGQQVRSRDCTVVNECKGGLSFYYDYQACYEAVCSTGEKITSATFADWVGWGNWQACDKTCGEGDQKAGRMCSFEDEPMRFDKCAVDKTEPGISDNGAYKYRKCVDNVPCSGGGGGGSTITSGSSFVSSGQWGAWGAWSSCSATCGWGKKQRTRTCPVSYCPGADSSSYSCDSGTVCSTTSAAGFYSGWGTWSQWSQCDKTCGAGSRQRTRTCNEASCPGECNETEFCEATTCFSAFSKVFQDASTNNFQNICPYGKLLPGKFNQDETLDLLCFYPDGFARIYFTNHFHGTLAKMISWEGPTIHCSFAEVDNEMHVYVRDINNDGLDDLICHNQHTKEIMVTYNKGGSFEAQLDSKTFENKCAHTAMFEDIGGDTEVDLLCGDESNPIKYVFRRKGGQSSGTGTTWGRSAISSASVKHRLGIQVLRKPRICIRKTKPGDRVKVRYNGTLENGERFDARKVPFRFTLGHGDVIDGWENGLLEMCHGEERKLTVPPDMAYGDRGKPPSVPGNATLTYEIELWFQ